MPLKTTLVISKVVSDSVVNTPPRPSGYKVDLAVTDHINITNKIFVMQRELETPDGVDYVNTFYSIASTADLEELPTTPTNGQPFYLTSSISLIFRTIEELARYVGDIEALINQLTVDNDRVINAGATVLVGFPVTHTLLRYWGLSSFTTVTDQDIIEMLQDDQYTRDLNVDLAADAPSYLYFIFRNDLGALTSFTIDGVLDTPVLVTRSVVNARGYSASYRIYRSSVTHTGLSINLVVV